MALNYRYWSALIALQYEPLKLVRVMGSNCRWYMCYVSP